MKQAFRVVASIWSLTGGLSLGCTSADVVSPSPPGARDAAVSDGSHATDGGPTPDAAAPTDSGRLPDAAMGQDALPQDPDAGQAPDATAADGGGDPPDIGGIYPACEARGGTCVLDTLGPGCPPGTHPPFSGGIERCPTGVERICCVPNGGLGSPCEDSMDCTDGGCLAERSGYPSGGMCSSACDPSAVGCAPWQVCLPVYFSAALGMCMTACERDERCRPNWSCQAFPTQPFQPGAGTTYVCWQLHPTAQMLALGDPCMQDDECLSLMCRLDPSTMVRRCTARCDSAHPCLPGYTCHPLTECTSLRCGGCF